ncbi:MAG: hypothetical protein NTW64_01765 [Candidatus Omnitrophica bacterium]|nr:hypothetical protein [Candidatus Omnitrophota bacterium]
MPVETLSLDLILLFKKYNALLLESRDLENDLDRIGPYPAHELEITKLQMLTKEINGVIRLIKNKGYLPAENELVHGFVINPEGPG